MEKRALLGDIHPSGQLLATVGISLFITLIVLLAGFLFALPFVGKSLFQLLEGIDVNDPGNIGFMKYLQIVSHLGMFIIPSVLLAWLFGGHAGRYLYLDRIPNVRIIIFSGLVIFTAVPFINYILELNMQLHFPQGIKGVEEWMRRSEENAERMTRAFLSVETSGGLLFNLFMIAVIPAIGEELMFRGVLMRIFRKWSGNDHMAVWITAIIFSAIHMQFFGFFPRMILGVLFGYLVVWTGSLWPAIAAHFVNNGAAVIFFFLFHNQMSDGTFENLGKGGEGLLIAAVSLALTLWVMWYVKRLAGRQATSLSNDSW